MHRTQSDFKVPPHTHTSDGKPRLVGYELEFSGLSLDQATDALRDSLKAEIVSETGAQRICHAACLGEFTVELDWDFIKRKAKETSEAEKDDNWIEKVGEVAAILVPIEMVCPPVPVTSMNALDPMVHALRDAGAVGTEESLIAAYGVHINVELPQIDAPTLNAYLAAFSLLQWWLMEAQDVDLSRKITFFIAPFSEDYVIRLLSRNNPSLDQIATDYLEFNASRNRALDLLPMLAKLDKDRVRRSIDDPRIKPRPAMHYRLPNCNIERPGWSLSEPWNSWWIIEMLAHRPDDLDALRSDFLAAQRPILGANKKHWIDFLNQWLKDRALA